MQAHAKVAQICILLSLQMFESQKYVSNSGLDLETLTFGSSRAARVWLQG